MSDVRCSVLVLTLLVAAPWALIGTSSAQELATSQANPPIDAIREAQALLAGLGYAPGSIDADTWSESLSRAYRSFLRDAGLPTSETLTPQGLRRLREVARSEGVAAGPNAPVGPAPEPASDGLHRAVMAGDIDGARALLLRGAAVDGRDGRGWTPLMHAANKGYVLLVEMLLQSKASPDVRAPDGATALFMAVLNGHPEAIALLMRAGASVSVLGPRGLTPADAARLLYGNNQGQRPVPNDAAIHALLAGMTWEDAVKAAVADRREERDAATEEASLGLDKKTRALVQRRLSALGFSPGPDDGVFGRRTRLAIGTWQESEGFVRTGYLTRKQIDTLVAEGEKRAKSDGAMAARGGAGDARALTEGEKRKRLVEARREAKTKERTKNDAERSAIAEDSEPEPPSADTFQDIVGTFLSRALSAAEKIDSAYMRVSAFGYIARAQAGAGDDQGAASSISKALSIAEETDNEFQRSDALSDIAVAQAAVGDFRSALRTAERLDEDFTKATATARIAKAQAEEGDAQGAAQSISIALSITDEIDHPNFRSSLLYTIALAQAEAGDDQGAASSISKALSIAEGIDDKFGARSLALAFIAGTQAEVGDVRGALQTVERIDVRTSRLLAFSQITTAQIEAGDVKGVAQSFSTALSIAEKIDDDEQRFGWLGLIARRQAAAQAAAGDVLAALRTAERIDEDSSRAHALAAIAKAQAEEGNAQGAAQSISIALSIAERLDDFSSGVLSAIAVAQAAKGDIGAALRTVERATDSVTRAFSFASVAQTLLSDTPGRQ